MQTHTQKPQGVYYRSINDTSADQRASRTSSMKMKLCGGLLSIFGWKKEPQRDAGGSAGRWTLSREIEKRLQAQGCASAARFGRRGFAGEETATGTAVCLAGQYGGLNDESEND